MGVTEKIQDTGKGKKSVADDLEAVLRKHQGWLCSFTTD